MIRINITSVLAITFATFVFFSGFGVSMAVAGTPSVKRATLSELDAEAFDQAMQMYKTAEHDYERQPWTVAQYDRIVEAVGIYTREGQFAAIGAVVVALRDRQIDEATRRLDALQNTDGFVLEADIARQVDALMGIVDLLTNTDDGGAMTAPSTAFNQTFVTKQSPTSDDIDHSEAANSIAGKRTISVNNAPTSLDIEDDYHTTRVCFTIEVERYADRELAEQRVELLRRTYSRARLAIDNSTEDSFVVVVGYYPTSEEASKDLRSVGRTTGKLCRVAESTIAERL